MSVLVRSFNFALISLIFGHFQKMILSKLNKLADGTYEFEGAKENLQFLAFFYPSGQSEVN